MPSAALTIPADHGIAKLRWRCNSIGEEVISTFGFKLDSTSPLLSGAVNEQPDVCAETWCDAWTGAFGTATLAAAWTFVGVDISLWHSGQTAGGTPVAPDQGTHDVNVTGTGSFTCVPANCAVLVEKNTSVGGRVGKGRCYLPGGYLSASECSPSGALSGAAVAAYNANLHQLETNLGDPAVDIYLMLFHGQRHSGSSVIGAAGAPSDITSITVDGRVATQRRRMHR